MLNVSNTEISGGNGSVAEICHNLPVTTVGKIVEASAFSFILLTSLFGNTLVAVVVHRERRMRTTVNYFIVNMAISDLLCTVFIIPRTITETFTYPRAWLVNGVLGETLCKIAYFGQEITIAVSLLSLLAIAVERYHAITRPLTVSILQRKRRAAIIVLTWLVASALNAPQFYTFRVVTRAGQQVCSSTWEPAFASGSAVKAKEIEFLVDTICLFIIPFVVVTVLYSVILIKLNSRSMPGEANPVRQRQQTTRNRNVLRMLLAVVLALGFCWIPAIIYMYMATYLWIKQGLPLPCGFEIYGKCALYLTYLNSSVNPAIYFLFSANYRRGLRTCFRPYFRSFRRNPLSIFTKGTNKHASNRSGDRTREVRLVKITRLELQQLHNN